MGEGRGSPVNPTQPHRNTLDVIAPLVLQNRLSQVRALPPLPFNALIRSRLIVVFRGWPRLQLCRRIVRPSLPARLLRGRDRGLLRRKEHIVARPAQVRPAGAKTRLNATRVRHIGSAKPKRVRSAGIALLLGSLGEGGCLEQYEECGRRAPVTDPMRHQHDFLLRCVANNRPPIRRYICVNK
jgi:hypothetical protein